MDTFIESIDTFVATTEVDGYRKDLLVFKEFIDSKGINDYTWKDYLSGVRSTIIIDSVDHYIIHNSVSKVSTVNRYVAAIKEYFIFMFENNHIEKNHFFHELCFKAYNEESFFYQINRAISQNKKLKGIEPVTIYEENDVNNLILLCDEVLSMELQLASKIKKNYTKYTSALIFKLVLITGTTYRGIIKFPLNALNLKTASITINGFTIHLPNNLIIQLENYLEIRSHLPNNHNQSDTLFIQYNGDALPEQTSLLMTHFAGWTGRTDYNGLVKYAIVQMLIEGMGETIIKRFTGAGAKIFMSCWNHVEQSMNIHLDRYVDSKIRSIKTFDLL